MGEEREKRGWEEGGSEESEVGGKRGSEEKEGQRTESSKELWERKDQVGGERGSEEREGGRSNEISLSVISPTPCVEISINTF